jgi:signal recognition particle receptor subunit beta
MVFFNYATMQMAAKVVYYGPGLCGKTTNLHHIYGRTSPGSRGEMISLETETDRTLFFDLLPIDVGVIGGFKTRLQLYTVPGQVFYNTTRKLVLRGVDGIVFVADSQRAMKDANVESFQNMEANLQEIGLTSADIPLVLQFNKRDLATVLTVEELVDSLDPKGRFPHVEAVALKGEGVFETLKEISKLTLKALKKKMLGDEKPARTLGRPSTAEARAPLAAARPEISPAPAAPPPLEPPEEPRVSLSDLRADAEAAASALAEQIDSDEIFEHAEAIEDFPPPPAAPPPSPAQFLSERADETLEDAVEAAPRQSEDAVQVDFDQAAAPAPVDVVKHVKVRSNVDILSELEKLRKNATLKPMPDSGARSRAGSNLSIDDLLATGLNHRKEVQKLYEIEMKKKDLTRAGRLIFSVRLDDQKNKTIGEERQYEIELADMRDIEKLLVSLKLHVSGK